MQPLQSLILLVATSFFSDLADACCMSEKCGSSCSSGRSKVNFAAPESATTDDYQIERRQYAGKGGCTEEIKVTWTGGSTEKKFQMECYEKGTLRPGAYGKTILIIGSPTDDYFIFSRDRKAYYLKQKENWVRGQILTDVIQESPITAEEINKVKEWYEKLRLPTERFTRNRNNIEKERAAADETYEKLELDTNKLLEENTKEYENYEKEYHLRMADLKQSDVEQRAALKRELEDKNELHLSKQNDMNRQLQDAQDKHRADSEKFKERIAEEKRTFEEEYNKVMAENP